MSGQIDPTEFRMKLMKAGEVFAGIHKIKNKHQRRRIETERHIKFMDMLGTSPAAEAGLPVRPNPVTWVKDFVISAGGVKPAEKRILEFLELYKLDDPIISIYMNSKNAAKTKVFYKNALGYLRNNFK